MTMRPSRQRGAHRSVLLPGFDRRARLDRVALKVAAAAEQVLRALNGGTLEPTLPAVAGEPMAAVAMMNVSPEQAGHQCGYVTQLVQLEQEVENIGHQAVMIQPEAEALAEAW